VLGCRGSPEILSLHCTRDGFELPGDLATRATTAFLTLDVATTIAGRFREPHIQVLDGSIQYKQYFERSVRGERHLNLSPLLRERETGTGLRVRLKGERMRWKTPGVVSLFDQHVRSDETILVLAPHPDDAEIAAFGLYASRPSNSWVVTVTAGEWGSTDLSAIVPSAEEALALRARLRVWDSLRIPPFGRVAPERCFNLIYPDDRLGRMFCEPTRPFQIACESQLPRAALRSRNNDREFQTGTSECTWGGLVVELRRLLEKAKPDVIVAPHPLLDSHLDHVFTTVALRQALSNGAHQPRAIFLYVVHASGSSLFPDGPRDGMVSLPPLSFGPDRRLLADSIYSHSLSPELQQAKYFAVEAAFDLRTFSPYDPTPRQLLRAVGHEFEALLRGSTVDSTCFLRRAPRPNELFYVVSPNSLSELFRNGLGQQVAPIASHMAGA
jgi:LmbE family N-acetylglucosaminyl deacetylase